MNKVLLNLKIHYLQTKISDQIWYAFHYITYRYIEHTIIHLLVFQVSELKRNAKRNLTGTVRQMLRTVYADSLLKYYSFKGQKSKKMFSSLTSCSIIFGKNSCIFK